MAFDPVAYLETEGFDPEAYVRGSDVEARITGELGGVKQADGTYIVPGENGGPALHLDAQGNRVGAAPEMGMDAPATGLEKVVATAGSALLPVTPQFSGIEKGLQALGKGEDVGDAYRKGRDDTKRTVQQAQAKAGFGYQLLGGVLSGGVAAPAGAVGRVALSAGLGAAGAALDSDVDLTQGADLGAYARDVAIGTGVGALAGGLGEGIGAGLRKGAQLVRGASAKVLARQAAKEAAVVEAQYGKGIIPVAAEAAEAVPMGLPARAGYEIAEGSRFPQAAAQDLPGPSGFDVTDGSRFPSEAPPSTRKPWLKEPQLPDVPEALPGSPGYETIEGSRFPDIELSPQSLPGRIGYEITEGTRFLPPAPGPMHGFPAQASPQDLAKIAAERTKAYFASPLWASDIRPAIERMAPRYGKALVAAGAGSAFDEATGSNWGKVLGGGLGFNALGSTFAKRALGGVLQSPRVQRAVMMKLAPMFGAAAEAVNRGTVLGAAELAQHVVNESALGPPNLVAEQLIASGGLMVALGDAEPLDPDIAAANAPRSELDKAIAQTVGVTVLGGALEEHHAEVEKGLSRVFSGERTPIKHEMPDVAGMHDPQALIDRLARNTGTLGNVAPGVASELAAAAQRAVDYLATVSAVPPRAGPLAPEWVSSGAEKRSLRLAREVIASPMSILDAAASGMLVPEQVAALNAVYPMLGRSIQDAALAKLDAGAKVPYRARLMLGFLTGVDIDGTFASIGPNQQAIRAQSQKPSNQGAPTQGGADKLSIASRTAPTQEQEA